MLEKSIDKYGKRVIIESETGERKRKKANTFQEKKSDEGNITKMIL